MRPIHCLAAGAMSLTGTTLEQCPGIHKHFGDPDQTAEGWGGPGEEFFVKGS